MKLKTKRKIRKNYRLAKEKIITLIEFTVHYAYIALIFAVMFAIIL